MDCKLKDYAVNSMPLIYFRLILSISLPVVYLIVFISISMSFYVLKK